MLIIGVGGGETEGKKPLQLLTPLGRFPRVSLSRPWGLFFFSTVNSVHFPLLCVEKGMESGEESGREGERVSQGSSAFWNGKAKAS